MITSKELEKLLLWRSTTYDEPRGLYMLNRYGVMAVYINNVWTPTPSYPDFDLIINGQQYVFDVKVCSQSAWALTGNTSKSLKHQYEFMKRKARVGARCFILLHFNEKQLKTKTHDSLTIILPIPSPLWQQYETMELKSISRETASVYGYPVQWDTPTPRATKRSPNIYSCLTEIKTWGTK